MKEGFLQLGQYLVPILAIAAIDLNYPRAQTEGQGTIVRVWLNGSGGGMPQHFAVPGQLAPNCLDFRGNDAQIIRRWCAKSVDTGLVTAVLANTSAASETGTTATAAAPSQLPSRIGRPKGASSKPKARTATAS